MALPHPTSPLREPPRPTPMLAVWLLLAALLLVLAPSQIWFGAPVWRRGTEALVQALGLAAAFGIAAALLPRIERGQTTRRLLPALAAGTLPLAAYYFALLLISPSYSRGTLLVASALFGLLIVVPWALPRRLGASAAALGVAVAAIVLLGVVSEPVVETALAPGDEEELDEPADTLITLRGTLVATHLSGIGDTIRGGGLGRLGEDLLLVTGAGEFFRVRLANGEFAADRLALHAPLNRSDFIAATDATVKRELFRVAGLLVQPVGDSVRVTLSHHHWKADEGCFVLRISETTVEGTRLHGGWEDRAHGAPAEWRTVYETRPCLRLKQQGDAFAGQQAGGRIAALGDTALIVTVGDHQFDGVNSTSSYPQARDNDYGKTLIIPRNRPARIFTLGHRNPQGLLVTPAGDIWITEHGPRGGDELDLLVDGANYGWPLRTYGTQYDDFTWPLDDAESPRTGFTDPRFVWVPSIGVSNLIQIETDAVPGWRGDFLVAALGTESLYRLHREEGRIVYSERIETDARVRDLAEAIDGRLVLWFDDGRLSVFTPVEPE